VSADFVVSGDCIVSRLRTIEPRLATLEAAVGTLRGNATFGSGRQASRRERGYGPEWDRLRETILQRDEYLCVACRKTGVLTAARTVDHILPKSEGGSDDPANLQSLCKPCHEAKTAAENAARWGKRDKGPRIGSQLDAAFPGWLTPTRAHLTIVFGPPASGKSTLVASRAGADIVIDLDLIAAELSGAPLYRAGDRWLGRALAERNRRLSCLLEGQRAWLITTGAATERPFWLEALRPADSLVCRTDEQVCVQRIRQDARRPEDVKARHIGAVRAWWRAERAGGG
jgi:hypothetical protein